MTNQLEFLPEELIILALNKIAIIEVNGRYDHPDRRDILSLYLTCKKFKWLEKISISIVENYEINRVYSTFDIFGNNVNIILTHHYRANDFRDKY
jgi:hypothetical protein